MEVWFIGLYVLLTLNLLFCIAIGSLLVKIVNFLSPIMPSSPPKQIPTRPPTGLIDLPPAIPYHLPNPE